MSIFKYLYYLIIVTLVADLSISSYAYFQAYKALGYVPEGSKGYFWSVVNQSGESVQLPNEDFSLFVLIASLLSSAAFPIIVMLNWGINGILPKVRFDRNIVIITLLALIVFWILYINTRVFGWYGPFTVD